RCRAAPLLDLDQPQWLRIAHPRPANRLEAALPLLELEHISKHFGAIHAVNDVSLAVEAGEIVGLMGDNGAGKSVLCRIIAGNYQPSHGTIRIDGKPVVLRSPMDARSHGIDMVQQD